jgi:hypothetical protein
MLTVERLNFVLMSQKNTTYFNWVKKDRVEINKNIATNEQAVFTQPIMHTV